MCSDLAARSEERGTTLVFFSVVTAAVLMVIGLYFEASHVMYVQDEVEVSLDAALVRGAERMFKGETDKNVVTETVQEVLRANLLAKGFAEARVTPFVSAVTVQFSDDSRRLSVETQYVEELFLAPAVFPGYGNRMALTVASAAEYLPPIPGSIEDSGQRPLIILVLDRSSSMNDSDDTGQAKFDSLKEAVKSLLDANLYSEAPYARMAIAVFDEFTSVEQYVTDITPQNIEALKANIDQLDTGQGTAMAKGMVSALEIISDAEANDLIDNDVYKPLVIALSDGLYNTEAEIDPPGACSQNEAATDAILWSDFIKISKGIPVYLIGFGSAGDFDEQVMRRQSSDPQGSTVDYGCNTGFFGPQPQGFFQHASNQQELFDAFEEIVDAEVPANPGQIPHLVHF